jgi:Fe-S oxidoreductase
MAGAFGFQAETQAVSEAMAALELAPALAALPDDAIVVADGTSCRQMIRETGGRRAWHVAQVLDRAVLGRLSGRP